MRGKLTAVLARPPQLRITPAHAGKTQAPASISALPSDHPRACGENNKSLCASMNQGGSPPRMRGKLASAISASGAPRITPAHAGKTNDSIYKYEHFTDHPRACGENSLIASRTISGPGSPPRMRGKRAYLKEQGIAPRITPAHAGKTPARESWTATSSDHPRACGENTKVETGSGSYSGSPPRMRGKPSVRAVCTKIFRITPAHAGKTSGI